MSEPITYKLSDNIATITMDDGKVNAMSVPMTMAIRKALDQAEKDGAVVVLTGREKVFSAGFDMNVFTQGREAVLEMLRSGAELAERIMSFPLPVVGACTGHAIAMGAFLLMPCDIRLGAAGPYKIGMNEVAIGMTLPYFAIAIAQHRLSPAHFNLAATTGRLYAPDEALQAGFLDRAVPVGELTSTTRETALGLVKLDMKAHHATKLRVRAKALNDLREAIDTELTLDSFLV